MKITFSDKLIAYLTLISGLSISAVAVWYSVAGLVSIFAAAVVPIMVMGIALELSKLVATVWLKMNWKIAPVMMRTYLVIAIIILMFITSMGIFGFLSKAHLDQAVPTGDVVAKVAIIDEKINTAKENIKSQKENIESSRKALAQMDNQVNERLSRSEDEKGAERAVQIRRNQAKERKALQTDIAAAQKEIEKINAQIATLNEERAPVASELRKVEAEVGPIKYIAALIYGDNPDANILERAVRWVIIIIVAVFDPLAVVLLLASQYSFQYFRRVREEDDGMRDEYDFTNAQRGPILDKETEEFFERGKEIAREIDANDGRLPDDYAKTQSYLYTPMSWFKSSGTEGLVPKPEATKEEDPLDIPILEGEEMWAQEAIDNASKNKNFDPEEYYEYLDGQPELDESDILEAADGDEKAAMHRWKDEHPNSSLKLQRRLFEKGVIKELPWAHYLKPQADFVSDNDAAAEALKWAQEQIEESKKKDTVTWMETENGHQVKKSREI